MGRHKPLLSARSSAPHRGLMTKAVTTTSAVHEFIAYWSEKRLEQGREIGVSARFLDNLAQVLRLDATERRHLFLLAHERLSAEPGKTWCVVPPLVLQLMRDLEPYLAYVLNLRWDVLAFNEPADRMYGFGSQPPGQRNLMWLLFTAPALRECIKDWENRLLSCYQVSVGTSPARLRDQTFTNWWVSLKKSLRSSELVAQV